MTTDHLFSISLPKCLEAAVGASEGVGYTKAAGRAMCNEKLEENRIVLRTKRYI